MRAPGALRVRGRPTPLAAAEVSLLSVKHSWRRRGLTTPLLLGELRSRAAARGLRRAVYTAAQGAGGAPLACAGCFHRPLRRARCCGAGSGSATRPPCARRSPPLRSRPPARNGGRRRARAGCAGRRRRALLDARAGGFAVGPALDDAAFRHRFLGGGGARSLVVLDRRKKPCAFVSFAVVALRDGAGRAVAQAQLLGFAAAPFAAADGAPPAPEALLVAALLRARRLGAHVFTAPALAEHTPRLLESLGFFAGDGATHLEIHDAAAADGEAAAGEDALPSDLKAEEVAWLPFFVSVAQIFENLFYARRWQGGRVPELEDGAVGAGTSASRSGATKRAHCRAIGSRPTSVYAYCQRGSPRWSTISRK